MRARLIPVDGGTAVELVKDLTLIGRGDDCDLQIDHKSVSKRHCVLVKTDGLVLIRDLGSTNGTRVNGHRVRRGALLPNDTLSVANFRYNLKFGEAPVVAGASQLPDAVSQQDESSETELELPPKAPVEPVQRNSLPDDYPEPKG